MDGGGERRKELRRLSGRFLVAVSLDLFTGVCKRVAGLDHRSAPNPETKTTTNGHVAFYWASEFNLLAHLAFLLVISQIIILPMSSVERMRRLREDCDMELVLGFIFTVISLSFLAYLRCFVRPLVTLT